MEYAKTLLKLCVLFSALTARAETHSFSNPSEGYARGVMVAVDTRDHKACQTTKEYVSLLVPFLKEDICAPDGENHLSVVVMTFDTTEWDFQAEVDLSRKAPRSVRDTNVGFVRGGRAGLLFLLPAARESDHYTRVALKRGQLSVAHVRLADLSMLRDMGFSNMSVPFLLMRRDASIDENDREATERMVRRVRISRAHSASAQKDESDALSSLNILDNLNMVPSSDSQNRFEMDLFIPKDECTAGKSTGRCERDSVWWLPSGIGFSFKIIF
nr:hypothetical protein CKG001_33450 [Bdellovibrio sp. CKG001]BFD64702.1 hypothetical protein BdHM001_33830 [Bdellovibrio sp. HM001]